MRSSRSTTASRTVASASPAPWARSPILPGSFAAMRKGLLRCSRTGHPMSRSPIRSTRFGRSSAGTSRFVALNNADVVHQSYRGFSDRPAFDPGAVLVRRGAGLPVPPHGSGSGHQPDARSRHLPRSAETSGGSGRLFGRVIRPASPRTAVQPRAGDAVGLPLRFARRVQPHRLALRDRRRRAARPRELGRSRHDPIPW